MRFQANKLLYLFSIPISISLAMGCGKVDTNPTPDFIQVRTDVANLTGKNIFWDSSLESMITPISTKELLDQELTNNSAVKIALLNNKNLQAEYESLGIAKAHLAQAGLLKNPLFSFSYRFATKSNTTDLIDLGLFQNFLELLLIPMKKKMAQAELEATKSMIISKILDVIAETKIAFYTLQATEQIWKLKKKILLATELSYDVAKKLFEAGNINELGRSIERSFYEQSKLEVASWEVNVLEMKEKLNILMGLWGHQIAWRFSADFPEIPARENRYDDIVNESITNSIDLQIAYKKLMAVATKLGINTSKLILPRLDIGVSSERDDSIWYVGPGLNIAVPLFDFGQASSAEARAIILQHWNHYTALAVVIRSKARSARFSLLNAFRQNQYLQKVAVPLAEQITHDTLLQYNAMQIGVFHLLKAKQIELEKKIQFVLTQKEYWIAKTEVQTLVKGHVLHKNIFELSLKNRYE